MTFEINVDARLPNSPSSSETQCFDWAKAEVNGSRLLESYTSCTDPRLPGALYTHLGGSLMPPEVIEAMEAAAQNYVPIGELSRAAGARIAELTGNSGALVTTGAAGAIFTGTCACIARDDPDKAKRLPFTDGMKNEIVTQKLHMTGWIRQCEAAGGRMIDIEKKDEMERAIGGKTAMLYYLVTEKHFGTHRDQLDAPGGKVSLAECIQIAKKHRVPLLIDAAAELPPLANLAGYTKMGHPPG